MWRDHALPRLRQRGLGIDRAAETLRLTGIGESMVVDVVGKALLEAENPRMATYARPDSVDLRVSAVATAGRSARELVDEAIASLSPRLDAYVFGRGDDDWPAALGRRLGHRLLATVEVGTGGYLGLLLGSAPFLLHAEQLGAQARQHGGADVEPVELATRVRRRAGAHIGLAAVAHEAGDDMRVEVGLDLEGVTSRAGHTVFRAGDLGRRRAANAAAAELWRRLG